MKGVNVKKKKDKIKYFKVICRESIPEEVLSYVVDGKYTDPTPFCLRSKFNPELEYYAIAEGALTKEQTPIILNLIKMCGECSLAVRF